MTEHLPECPLLKPCCDDEQFPEHGFCGNYVGGRCLHCMAECICDALRACEQRVFALHPEWTMTGLCKPDCAACRRLTELITEWENGYKKGLDAAHEAVEAIPAPYKIQGDFDTFGAYHEGRADSKDLCISAIDALREQSHD